MAARTASMQISTGKALANKVKNSYNGENTELSGVTPDKPSGKVKYASARIKLLRVNSDQVK